jgi:hypothetical protein
MAGDTLAALAIPALWPGLRDVGLFLSVHDKLERGDGTIHDGAQASAGSARPERTSNGSSAGSRPMKLR